MSVVSLRKCLVLACLATLTVAACTNSGPATAPPQQDAKPSATNPFRVGHTLVIPHGGGDGLFPENTLLAYTSTLAMGADVVDVDLRLSADGVVIAFHDSTVDRITGSHGAVAQSSYDELSKLDAGWAFSPADQPKQHPFRAKGITIPTMEAILQEFPQNLLSLDLKDESMSMIAPVCDLLVRYKRLDDVFVGSNSDDQILKFRKACPTVRTSATMVDVYASRDAQAANDQNFVPDVTVDQPPFRINGRQLVDETSLAWAHKNGVAILTWVVNDEADMQLLIDLGVDGIYTSYPDRLLKLLKRNR